jgi:hypothetical protein
MSPNHKLLYFFFFLLCQDNIIFLTKNIDNYIILTINLISDSGGDFRIFISKRRLKIVKSQNNLAE